MASLLRRLSKTLRTGGRQVRSSLAERAITDPSVLRSAVRIMRDREGFVERFAGSDAQFAHLALGFIGKSKSQHFQDVWALMESGFKHGGYFVEVGAFNGVDISNTYMLEKSFGWSGLLAEPNPQHHDNIRAHRTAALSTKCVHATSGQRMAFWVTQSSGHSALAEVATLDAHAAKRQRDHEEIEVETISLNDLLVHSGAPAEIDFISMDTEGNEPAILSTFDFARWRVGLWCIEHNHHAAAEAEIDRILLGNGYRRRYPGLSETDGWYARS